MAHLGHLTDKQSHARLPALAKMLVPRRNGYASPPISALNNSDRTRTTIPVAIIAKPAFSFQDSPAN